MESDMHNLQPSVGEVMAIAATLCTASGMAVKASTVMRHEGRFQRKSCRATSACTRAIARTYFYMRDQYNLTLSRRKRSCSTHGTRCIQLPTGSAA